MMTACPVHRATADFVSPQVVVELIDRGSNIGFVGRIRRDRRDRRDGYQRN
jgi:hypothetical protein